MSLREYLRGIYDLLAVSPQVASVSLSFDERFEKAAYLLGRITLVDGSLLHVKEFLVADPEVRKVKYAYHWVTTDGVLIFRYDNAADPAARHLASFPHHKHAPEGLTESEEPTLGTVLREIGHLLSPS